ncbi:MAG: 2-dehydropantoate 2-reductase [Faecalibacterium sp.]
MKIAIIGAGAMGMLFAGYLSKENETVLIGCDARRMSVIAEKGVAITEKDGSTATYYPNALISSEEIDTQDLVILLTKAMDSRIALAANPTLFGKGTILMTLQNGSGHETILQDFAPRSQIAVGTTQDGSSITGDNSIRHSGVGTTAFGMIEGDLTLLCAAEKTFCRCGFETTKTENIKQLIWNKLIINVSSSALSGLLQMPQGYCLDDSYAWEITQMLIKEAVAVANADGMQLEETAQIARVKNLLKNARSGLVSVYADLKAGRFTEVDTISGSVIARGKALNVPTPTHQLIVNLIHAMERRKDYDPSAF